MALISEIHQSDRPRERLLTCGAKNLSTTELLAILIGTGTHQGTQALSAIDLANQVLLKISLFQDDPLLGLRTVSAQDLQQIQGIGDSKSATILAAVELARRLAGAQITHLDSISTAQAAARLLAPLLLWQPSEQIAVLLLNTHNQPILTQTVSLGTCTEALAHPREIFRSAIAANAVGIIVAHNHPSGSLVPSNEDLTLTRRLLSASEILGIALLDHLILSDSNYLSLRDTTNLWS